MSTDTDYQSEIVCPHCGYAYHNSWEVDFGQGIEGESEQDCPNCEKPFTATRHCEVTYSTTKKKETTK